MLQRQHIRQYALLLQVILVTRFGLLFLRVLATSGMWGFAQFAPLNIQYIPIIIIFIILLTGFIPWVLLKRIHPPALTSWWFRISIGLSILRVAEQLNHNAVLDYCIASGGLILFTAYFLSVYQASRFQRWITSDVIIIGIAAAMMLDTALRGALWTLDLSWQQGIRPLFIVIPLSIILTGLTFIITPQNGLRSTNNTHPSVWGVLLLSIYFFFSQHLYSDVSCILQQTGWALETGLLFLLIGNFLSILAVRWASTRCKKRIFSFLPWSLLFGSILITAAGSVWQYIVALYIMEISSTLMVALALKKIFSLSGNASITQVKKIYLFNFIAYILLIILFYTTGMPTYTFVFVSMLSAVLFWKTVLQKPYPSDFTALPPIVWKGTAVVLILAILIAPLSVKQDQIVIEPTASSDQEINIMQWNMHESIDAYGRLSLQQQAELIRTQNVDILSLNEVNRGSLLSGGVDALLWLSHNLEMHAAYGSTIGTMSGNAFLSKLPIEKVESVIYSQESILPSGCVAIDILADNRTVQFVSTHVVFNKAHVTTADFKENNTGNLPGRVDIFRDLVDACVDTSIPFILLGDMNARPDTKAIDVLRATGLVDAAGSNTTGYTVVPPIPPQRIDYVFSSPQIILEAYQVIEGTLSDHFPITVSLNLKNEVVGAE